MHMKNKPEKLSLQLSLWQAYSRWRGLDPFAIIKVQKQTDAWMPDRFTSTKDAWCLIQTNCGDDYNILRMRSCT